VYRGVHDTIQYRESIGSWREKGGIRHIVNSGGEK
jgi:hypothetical protein